MNQQNNVRQIVETVSTWNGVSTSGHRFGGVEFTLGNVEIGHVHAHGMVDIPFTRAIREILVAAGDAEPHHLLAESGWITLYVRTPSYVNRALRLFRLSWLQKRRQRDRTLTPSEIEAELDQLGFDSAIRDLMLRRRAEADMAD
jgi:Ni,Fe-hydrogenase I large subunit